MSVGGWSDGWLTRARRSPSPNFGPRPPGAVVDLVVVHSISLPPGVFDGSAVERFFANRLDFDEHPDFDAIRGLQVSAHFLLRRHGELLQFVSCDDRAWHAGESSWRGRAGCNDYSIGIELEGLAGGPFEPSQYAALAGLMDDVLARYPIRDVAGHEHVAPGRKDDPGAGFDWSRLRRSLTGRGLRFPH
ncbi:MAG TPA: 1,6-anhydro-N-acetylmuramyl-L-alanine amidase AmpD [Caldimonas sp.]|nr:1,6-anhydro-N-acetylmuramyl-L-alanine amidase AmpD [Caldimonas sp.]HEX2540884.1 1,6-anhydro-N-acetylmuramyl-L-alanine amidase AmpD [Caldimonas sp.]